jgi:hypothetical protein
VNAKALQITSLLGLLTFAIAQETSRPEVPDKIKAPDHEQLVLEAHATGFQVYTCQVATDGKPAWTLKGPEAELRDPQDTVIGRHSAGPTWKHKDGSEVTAKMTARVDSPDSNAIPWLLLTVTSHAGGGALSQVTTIQRVHTKGGQQPQASRCGPSNINAESKSSYVADYYFYAPAK